MSSNQSNYRFPSRLALCAVIALSIAACGSEQATTAKVAAPAAAAPAAAPAPAPVESVAELIARANRAFAEQRFVAPAGDNALELFLRVRTLDPKHAGAHEALVELFPMTVSSVKAQLARNDVAEAARVIALLEQAMPDSGAMTDLRTELAKREQSIAAAEAAVLSKQQAAEVAAAQAKQRAEAAALAAAQPKPVTPAPVAETTKPAPAAPAPAPSKPAPPSGGTAPMTAVAIAATTGAAPPPSTTAAQAPAAPAVTSPVAIARYPAEYPAQARQRRVEGWVELEFTVDANGTVKDVAVVGSEPPRMFDRAAQRALQRWRFKPAERNGKAESTRTRTTINFKLG